MQMDALLNKHVAEIKSIALPVAEIKSALKRCPIAFFEECTDQRKNLWNK